MMCELPRLQYADLLGSMCSQPRFIGLPAYCSVIPASSGPKTQQQSSLLNLGDGCGAGLDL